MVVLAWRELPLALQLLSPVDWLQAEGCMGSQVAVQLAEAEVSHGGCVNGTIACSSQPLLCVHLGDREEKWLSRAF